MAIFMANFEKKWKIEIEQKILTRRFHLLGHKLTSFSPGEAGDRSRMCDVDECVGQIVSPRAETIHPGHWHQNWKKTKSNNIHAYKFDQRRINQDDT